MELSPESPLSSSSSRRRVAGRVSHGRDARSLRALLGQPATALALPPLAELAAGLVSIASGRRRRVLIPLSDTADEYALVDDGMHLQVSCYGTGPDVQVHLLGHRVSLTALAGHCAGALMQPVPPRGTGHDPRPVVAQGLLDKLQDIAQGVVLAERPPPTCASRRGGAAWTEPPRTAVAFGFDVHIPAFGLAHSGVSSPADTHALLFVGRLWGWLRGRRVLLTEQGPVLLQAARLLASVRELVTLWRRRRAGECRVPCGPFQVHHRVEADRQLQLALQTSGQPPVLARDLDLHAVASPVLKLCSELLRALVSVDGAQRNNLRVRTLREEIRGLKSALQGTRNQAGFVNPHAEELRLATQTVPVLCPSIDASTHKSLRFRSRWSLDIEGLEARSTFLCGDRIVSSSERYTLALSRSHGEVLWSAPEEGIRACMMAGSVLLRLTTDGRVELCEVEHGENYATSPVRLRPCHGSTLVAGGGTVPPVAVLRDGDEQLVAIDLRNGAPRWRFCDREAGRLHLRREGRLLLALSSSGVAHAIDVATGEVLWRYRAELEVSVGASIIGDRVLLAARHTSRRAFHLCAIDLFSGARVWQRDLDDAPNAAPIALGTLAALPLGEPADGILAAVDPKDGRLVWMVPDPGVGAGAAILAVDHMALVNAPTGILSCLHTATGELRWQRQLCNPVTDDLPRCLEPVLRGGALFVPSASVHVLRPGNGEVIADAIACELVPDLLRVDERGWVYVVEEHARMAAFAPAPALTLVQGGKR